MGMTEQDSSVAVVAIIGKKIKVYYMTPVIFTTRHFQTKEKYQLILIGKIIIKAQLLLNITEILMGLFYGF